MKSLYIKDIVNFLGEKVLSVEGEYEGVFIDNLADVSHVNETTLDWINPTKEKKQLQCASVIRAAGDYFSADVK